MIEPLKKTETEPPEPVVYFAYGSNTSTARLRERMPSCKPLGIATLPGHALRFHKRSTDKSGRCNAFTSESDRSVIGSCSASILQSVLSWIRPKASAAATSTLRSLSLVTKVAGERSLPISLHPTTSTTASNPMAGTRTLCLQVAGNTVCRQSILPNTSSRLRRSKIPTRTGTGKQWATFGSLGQ